jgi:CRP-like cAMP-binding protein
LIGIGCRCEVGHRGSSNLGETMPDGVSQETRKTSARPTFRNVLLDSLSAADLAALAPDLESIALPRRQILESPGSAISTVLFPESGIVSVMARAPYDRRIEVGLVGLDGMIGFGALLGDELSINESIVQVPGHGWRVATTSLVGLMHRSAALSALLLRYVHAFMAQTTQTALANGRSKLEERLARWLLMSHDRFGSNELGITHDFLAQMLGVRRAGVTIALQVLESRRLIRARRGQIIILDRAGLKQQANGSYGVAEQVYCRLIRPDWRRAIED